MTISRRSFLESAVLSCAMLTLGNLGPVFAAGGESAFFPAHEPLGEAQGIHPGRVVWKRNPDAISWSGLNYWWQPENYDREAIEAMIRDGIMALTGQNSPHKAWDALFEWTNRKNNRQGGYKPGQKIAIKVNMNGAGEYHDDPHGQFGVSYGNPVLLQALVRSLVRDGGARPDDIVVFDTCRIFPDYMRSMSSEGELAGVEFCYRNLGAANDARADENSRIQWAGQVRGIPTYFPTCLTEADYLINLGNVKGHTWGMTLTGKNLFGSIINADRRTAPATAGLHDNIIHGEMGDYSVIADLMARQELGGKTVLWMLDGLITALSETANISVENAAWEMPPFNGGLMASLFFSQDPVAIDSVGADFLANEPNLKRYNKNMRNKPQMENYLHEAALLGCPPSGTVYTDGSGRNPGSLGVHEHWNNAEEKLYSRDRGLHKGIELIRD